MNTICVAGSALAGLVLCCISAASAATPAGCPVPADRMLRRLELDLPGNIRVTRSVDIPADTEVLIEAFERNINARLEVRASGAVVATANSPPPRWVPQRLIVAKGPARKVDVTVEGLERAHGSVDVRMYRLASQDERRCVEFWRAMASGDAAYSRGEMIKRAEIETAPGGADAAMQSAVDSYARAVRIIGAGGLDEAQARAVHAQALLEGLDRYQEASEAALVAEARFKAVGDEFGFDRARYYSAWTMTQVATHTTDEADAKRKYGAARNTFLEVAASHLRRGERYEHGEVLGAAAYVNGNVDRYAEAASDWRQVLKAYDGLYEPDRIIEVRQNVAYYEHELGHHQEALKLHYEILADVDNIMEPTSHFFSIANTAWLELKLGKYDAALRHYSDAYAYGLRTESVSQQARALLGLGNTYFAIGNFGEALGYLERSLELRPAEREPIQRSSTLSVIANVLGDTGRGREAIARREEALRLAQGPLVKARVTLALIDDRIEVGDLAIAKSLTTQVLAARDMIDPTIRIRATLLSARIALAEGNARSAQRDARIAADYYRTHELVSSEFAALLILARATCAAGAREGALEIAETALQRAEEIRTFSSNPTLRASLWRTLRPAFGFTIGVRARANSCGGSAAADALGALAIAEASRGRALEDFRLRSSTDSVAQSKAYERRRELFEELAGVRQQLEGLSTTASADDERLNILSLEVTRLRREIDLLGGLPASSRLRADNLRPALRARIDAIPPDTAVVEYWLGKDEAFAWLLTRGRAQLVELGPAERIDAAARRMHDAMRSWLTGTIDERIARATELHQLIIAPLSSDLSRARTVYFIPDGALHAVPFAALAQGDRTHARFLIDSHDVAVAPAFLAIALDGERRAVRKSSAALVVVDPVYTRNDARFARAAEPVPAPQVAAITLRGSRSWSRLPATAREAATIRKLLDRDAVQVLSGFDANRDSLLGRDLARYDILHFATHAVADTEAPQLSALVLSTVDADGKPRVGEVFAGDLADQHLGAALVVLSGCETALGRAEAGEGLLGLRYAAHASGARSVIASLWPVMDAAGASLMDDMYAGVIGRDASPVAAMSRAMRNARKRWDDPALWAAFDVSIAGF